MEKANLLLALDKLCQSFYIPNDETRFLSPSIGIVRSFQGLMEFARAFFRFNQPYRLTEGRIVYYRSGTCRLRINLKEVNIMAKQIVVASPGTVIEILDVSPDLDFHMLAFTNELMEGWFKEEMLQSYLHGLLFLNITPSEDFRERIEQIMNLIWDIVHDDDFSKDEVRSLIHLLFMQINKYQKKMVRENHSGHSRQEEVFNRFIGLINQYAVHERNLAFYADRLCLSQRYLSTLIKKESGRTVMDWINDAAIQEIKLQLRHTDRLIYEIADEMKFPNSSFFTKYFRRLTGMTPKEYRDMTH